MEPAAGAAHSPSLGRGLIGSGEVLSFLGNFAQLQGGNRYPELIQDTPKKPLRVFLQAATQRATQKPTATTIEQIFLAFATDQA